MLTNFYHYYIKTQGNYCLNMKLDFFVYSLSDSRQQKKIKNYCSVTARCQQELFIIMTYGKYKPCRGK